jgi:hypothetical protein
MLTFDGIIQLSLHKEAPESSEILPLAIAFGWIL